MLPKNNSRDKNNIVKAQIIFVRVVLPNQPGLRPHWYWCAVGDFIDNKKLKIMLQV